MANNASGVYYPLGGDTFAPHLDMQELGNSLDGRIIVPVVNTTARNALQAAVVPSTSQPLYVDRADAPAGHRIEFTTSATGGWAPLIPIPAGGLLIGLLNAFGQIAVDHGLGYVPTLVTGIMSRDYVADTVAETTMRDYTCTVYSVDATRIVYRISNMRVATWAGDGLRVGILWSAK